MAIFTVTPYPELGEYPGYSMLKETSKSLIEKKALMMALAAIAGRPRVGASFYSDNQFINMTVAGLCGIVAYAAMSAVKG
jgi:hypothetical protein